MTGEAVFVRRVPAALARRQRIAVWAITALMLALPVAVTAILSASAKGGWAAVSIALGAQIRSDPVRWVGILAQLLAPPVLMWLFVWRSRRGRLVLKPNCLSYQSQIPLVGRVLNWSLTLDDLRQGGACWYWHETSPGGGPETCLQLRWGLLRHRWISPAYWQPANGAHPDTVSTRPAPQRRWGFVNWRSPYNEAVLSDRTMGLPLVQALLARNVPVPPVAGAHLSNPSGIDLMSHPSLRLAVLAVFACMLVGAGASAFAPHEAFIVAPPLWWWLLTGLLGAALALAALWGGSDGDPSRRAGDANQLKMTKLGLAALIGATVAGCSPLVALAWGAVISPAQTVPFVPVEDAGVVRLKPLQASLAVPSIEVLPRWFRVTDAAGAAVELPVRRGVGGLWWQYDRQALPHRLDDAARREPLSK